MRLPVNGYRIAESLLDLGEQRMKREGFLDKNRIGIEEAVLSFQEHGKDAITLASVEGEDGYHYHLFVSVEDGEIVACIGTPARN